MEQKLVCTLCDNKCSLENLGCPKGQRFYEKNTEPYCALCENHCLLTNLQCDKGMEFYGSNEKHGPVSQPIESPNFFVTFEMTAHQFLRVRGYSTTQIRVMRFIHNHGSANLKNLQDALSIKSAAMSELVTKLEDKGLVYRTTSQKDRRVKELRLTEMGEEAMRQQEKREEQMDLFSALTDEEKSTLDTLLRKLGNDWKQRES